MSPVLFLQKHSRFGLVCVISALLVASLSPVAELLLLLNILDWGWAIGTVLAVVSGFVLLLSPFLLTVGLCLGVVALVKNKKVDETSIKVVLVSGSMLSATIFGISLASTIRENAFLNIADRSLPLIAAIKKYEKEKGQPPSALGELVPSYISAIPGTGVAVYPKYEYYCDDKNRWMLKVPCNHWGFNWDEFTYDPEHEASGYSEQLAYRACRRIKNWLYFYE